MEETLQIESIQPLSPMQEGMLFHYLMDPASAAYFEQTLLTITGHIDMDTLAKSFQELFARYDIFRTVFMYEEMEQPYQIVLQEREASVYYENITHLNEEERNLYIRQFQLRDREQGFDLTQDVLMRLSVIQVEPKVYKMIWSHHHILMDGWCLGIIMDDFFQIYEKVQHNEAIHLPFVRPYHDYIQWLQTQDPEEAEEYWSSYLEGYTHPATGFPLKQREPSTAYVRAEATFQLDQQTTDKFVQLTRQYEITANSAIQALWGLLLQSYYQIEDIVFGAVVSGRPTEIEGIEKMVGLFINTLPVRVSDNGQQTLVEIMRNVQKSALDSEKYQYTSLAQLQAKCGISQKMIDHILVFQNYPVKQQIQKANDEQNVDFIVQDIEEFEQTNYDLNLIIALHEQLELTFSYNEAVFSASAIQQLGEQWLYFIQQFVHNPHQFPHQLELITEQASRMIDSFNDTSFPYPKEKTIAQLFEEQARKTPEKVAVVDGEQEITYNELNKQADQLAQQLKQLGVRSQEIVGLLMDRSIHCVIGILGILKAGGAYLPIDPSYPLERINDMLGDSQTTYVVAKSKYQDRYPSSFHTDHHFSCPASSDIDSDYVLLSKKEEASTTTLTNDQSLLYKEKDECHSPLAYVIYTSGSTGKPKGVLIEQKGLVNYITWRNQQYHLNEEDTLLQLISISFDGFGANLYSSLLAGAKLVLIHEETSYQVKQVIDVIRQHKVSHMSLVPSVYHMIVQHASAADLESLRSVVIAGEKASRECVRQSQRKCPHIQLINEYGPTENTIATTYHMNMEPSATSIIGRPIGNQEVLLLDRHERVLPIGVTGELCVSGEGLAKGYLRRSELTKDRFVVHPKYPDKKIYKTGDLAKWLPNGTIEYVGRMDDQVKIRGLRIELGEVENKLATHELIQQSVVTVIEEHNGNDSLCAYYQSTATLQANELRTYLLQFLPEYMLPAYFVQIEQIPLTLNGKVDRQALPQPKQGETQQRHIVPPTNETEEMLIQIWKDTLGVEEVGITDSFFEVGGHSLHAMQVISRIQVEFQKEVPLKELFQHATVEQLAKYIQELDLSEMLKIQPAESHEYYPVTSMQKRLFVLSEMNGGNTNYNMPHVLELRGEVQIEKLQQVFQQMIERHEAFRTSFYWEGDELVQRVHPTVSFTIDTIDPFNKNLNELIEELIHPFDLSIAPLLRVRMIQNEADTYYLFIDIHHIVSDGVSIQLLIEEFMHLYHGEELPDLLIQYKDFAVWQQNWMNSNQKKKQEEYWLKQFAADIPVLELPTDYERPVMQRFEGATLEYNIQPRISKQIIELSAKMGTTLYMTLLATYTVLLAKYSGQDDLIVGSPIAGRNQANLDQVIGMFVNTLAIRNQPSKDLLFSTYLIQVKERVLKALENQNYPFELLLEKLDLRRELSRNPLFDTMFLLQNMNKNELKMEHLHLSTVSFDHRISKFDLTVEAVEEHGQLYFQFEYSTHLFSRATIERMAKHLERIMDLVTQNPEIRLADIQLIDEKEQQQLIEDVNPSVIEYPREKSIVELFEEQVRKYPNACAVQSSDSQLSYADLHERSNDLAYYLQQKGIAKEEPIAILADRSPETIVGILAILKAGGAYVPIDPAYPAQRIEYILQDCGSNLLLYMKKHHELSFHHGGDWICLDEWMPSQLNDKADRNWRTEQQKGTQDGLGQIGPREAAYIMYTSGSTGLPKGVIVEHRNVVRLVKNTNYIQLDEKTRILQTGSMVFDASTFEIWGALLNGGQLHLVEQMVILDGKKLQQVIEEQKINVMWLTSPLFTQLVEQNQELFHGLDVLLVGGDVLSVPHIRRIKNSYPQLKILNGYGPTENTTFSTYYEIEHKAYTTIPIGKPIQHSTAYVVDSELKLLPIGVAGELCVGGDGVARGYLHQERLTKEKFIDSPYKQGERWYRTGDLARRLSDGTLEYLGRIDEQVKIRGYRIEPSEISRQILQHPNVKEVVVLVREEMTGEKELCAYLAGDNTLTSEKIRKYVEERLPDYMIPSTFTFLDKLPLTLNGKVDRNALPEPDRTSVRKRDYAPPQNQIQELLSQIWSDVLGVSEVGILDNFFELGGDSIKALQIVTRLNQKQYQVEVKHLFAHPTVEGLAPFITEWQSEIDQGEVTGLLPLTPIQHWFFEQNFTDQHHWNQSVMLFSQDGFDEVVVRTVFQTLIEHHDALRIVFYQEDGKWFQRNRGIEEGELYSLQKYDFRELGGINSVEAQKEQVERLIEEKSTEIQGSIDLEQGPLVKLGLFHTNTGDHLLIAIHHLMIDGVSWRILFEDLRTAYHQVTMGQQICLPEKTHSYRTWAIHLQEKAAKSMPQEEIEYWTDLATLPVKPLPIQPMHEQKKMKTIDQISIRLERNWTEALINRVHHAYRTEINDLLLTALGLTITEWTKQHYVGLYLEGHGREEIIEGINVSRTVGWFTSIYPVVLSIESEAALAQLIKKTKESLRKIPNKGIGYGILNYLADEQKTHDVGSSLSPQITFNYLGQFDEEKNDTSEQEENQGSFSGFDTSALRGGEGISPEAERKHVLDITGSITEGQLTMTFFYHQSEITQEVMIRLVQRYEFHLQQIIEHCLEQEDSVLTPSDLGNHDLSIEELDDLLDDIERMELE